MFQESTSRQVVVIIEAGGSGTFIDDLMDDDITVITSTGDGTSYIKPIFTDTDMPYNSFTSAFIESNAFINVITLNFDPYNPPDDITINDSLKEAFISAGNRLENWALKGPPFGDQAPQMASSGNIFSFLSFSMDGETPLEDLFIDQNASYTLTIIGQDSNNAYTPLSNDVISYPNPITFSSSDIDILDPNEDLEIITDDPSSLLCTLTPHKNGRCTLIAHVNLEGYSHLLLSAKLTIEVAVDEPGFSRDKKKMAIIAAGYKGTGDYLFESTNTIANHAYKTLRAMGYTKQEIFYYNPFFFRTLITTKNSMKLTAILRLVYLIPMQIPIYFLWPS